MAEWQHDRATGAADREGGDIQQSNGAGNRERSLLLNIQAAPVCEPSAIPGASENGDHRILPQLDNTGHEAIADSLIRSLLVFFSGPISPKHSSFDHKLL